MFYFRWQLSTLLQNFIHLRQSAAELLLFVQKSKVVAATILDFIYVQYFGIHVFRTSNIIHTAAAILNYNFVRSVLGVDRRSCTSEQKITSGRSPLYLITFITLLM